MIKYNQIYTQFKEILYHTAARLHSLQWTNNARNALISTLSAPARFVCLSPLPKW